MIHPVNDGGQIFTGRRRDHDLPGAAFQVGAGLLFARKKTGALDHHVDPQVAPGEVGRITLRQALYLVTVDDHVVAFDRHAAGETPVGGVVLG